MTIDDLLYNYMKLFVVPKFFLTVDKPELLEKFDDSHAKHYMLNMCGNHCVDIFYAEILLVEGSVTIKCEEDIPCFRVPPFHF